MVRISFTAEAFEVIVDTLPLGSVGHERERTATGGYFIGWSALAVARLALGRPERLGNVDAGRRAHCWRKT